MNAEQKKMERKEVIVDESTALENIADGMTIAIGGFFTAQHPMSLIRGLAKAKRKNLTVIGGLSSSLEVDMLIGCGCIKTLISSYVGAESAAAIGPFFKNAAEKGTINIWECDELIVTALLQATASGVPSIPVRVGLGTDLPRLNPELVPFNDPVSGEPMLSVPAKKIDVAILHASSADSYGNVQYQGNSFMDKLIARAAEMTITTVDRIVSPEAIRQDPFKTAYTSDMVVNTPFGAHPFSSLGSYIEDDAFLKEFAAAAFMATKGDLPKWDQFRDEFIHTPKDHFEYLEKIGIKKLFSLSEC